MTAANAVGPRDRLLAATETMLREVGMAGTGIKDVVKRSGAPIGSLYHYFPGGKAQLVHESLTIHAGKSKALIARFFNGKKPAWAAVKELFEAAAQGFDQQGADKGCAIGAVSLDLTSGDAEARRICQATFDDWAATIAPHLPFRDKATRQAFATTIVAAIEGAFVLSRAAQSGAPFRDVGKSLAALLKHA
jgi:AcrR family transcriptional regulator